MTAYATCPRCLSVIELDPRTPTAEVFCPACGSGFHVDAAQTTGRDPGGDSGGGGSGTLRGAGVAFGRLGRFEVLGKVGVGSFGTVCKARDPQLDRLVAIKVPHLGVLQRQQDLDRFFREGRSAARLRHPAIVPVYEVGRVEGLLPYLVSAFVHGVTLTDSLAERRPGPREAARLAAALAGGLQYAHDNGVVHRDVKPSNVLLDAQGQPHLTDFGLAKGGAADATMTVEGQVLGTPAYMSPEQARGEAYRVDGRSDVYMLAERHAARAVGLLRKLRAADFFRPPANVDNLKRNTDLNPLRSREDFRRLAEEVEGRPGTGTGG